MGATCTENGTAAYDYCSVCKKKFVDGVEKSDAELVIPATGEHVYDDENDMICNTPNCGHDRAEEEGQTPQDPEWTPAIK